MSIYAAVYIYNLFVMQYIADRAKIINKQAVKSLCGGMALPARPSVRPRKPRPGQIHDPIILYSLPA